SRPLGSIRRDGAGIRPEDDRPSVNPWPSARRRLLTASAAAGSSTEARVGPQHYTLDRPLTQIPPGGKASAHLFWHRSCCEAVGRSTANPIVRGGTCVPRSARRARALSSVLAIVIFMLNTSLGVGPLAAAMYLLVSEKIVTYLSQSG